MMNTFSNKVSRILLHLLGIFLAFICAMPVIIVLVSSFHEINDTSQIGISFRHLTLANYTQLLQMNGMIRWVINTLIICIATTILEVIIDTMAGFAFAKLKFRGRHFFFILLISTMMLPFSITLIPTYLLVSKYGLINTYAGLILPALSGPFGVYLLRQFIYSIPDSLSESAKIDGATSWQIFYKIILPLCLQPAAVLAIMTFVAQWNNFLWPLLVTQTDDMRTLTVGIATANTQFYQSIGTECAGAMISVIPMAILFLAFQRFFLKGITSGAMKG